jgi:hypothetical protein
MFPKAFRVKVVDLGKEEASKEENKQSSQNDIQNGCFTSVPSLLLLVCLFMIHDSPQPYACIQKPCILSSLRVSIQHKFFDPAG